jgi:hypothetical protein
MLLLHFVLPGCADITQLLPSLLVLSCGPQALKQAKNFEIRKITRRLAQARTETAAAAAAGAAAKSGKPFCGIRCGSTMDVLAACFSADLHT